MAAEHTFRLLQAECKKRKREEGREEGVPGDENEGATPKAKANPRRKAKAKGA